MTDLPEVGALVEVTVTGTVQRHGVDGLGFMIVVPGAGRAWLPASAAVKVLAAPRPSEVLLLDCGHLTDTDELKTSTSGDSGAWCLRCGRWKHPQAVGSVTW